MLESLSGATGRLAHLALDAAMVRHQVIANNIANADVPGYQTQRLDFEAKIRQFSEMVITRSAEPMIIRELDGLKQRLVSGDEFIVEADSQPQLDDELVALTENVLHYRALLEALSKRGDIIGMAIKERG